MELTTAIRAEIEDKVATCDDAKCSKQFIRRVDNQRFCSPGCASRCHSRERAAKRRAVVVANNNQE